MPDSTKGSGDLKFVKWIYDSVHGYIGVTEPELAVINHRLFQRLHHIRQLGPAYLVYPGATHTRFAHSLGAMFVMGEFVRNLRDTDSGELVITESDKIQKLRLAALLHDIGHHPFSHVIDDVMKELHPQAAHESLGRSVIKRFGIGDALNKVGFARQEIVNTLEGLQPLARDSILHKFLLDSDLDVDRVDYLLRDSYFTGVGYGYIDAPRLMRTMTYDAENRIVFKKGIQALENFFLGRFHMYQSVYYHKTVIGFEKLVTLLYLELIKHKNAYTARDILRLDEASFFNYHDNYLFRLMFENKSKFGYVAELIRMFLQRERLAVAIAEPAMEVPGKPTWLSVVVASLGNPTQRALIAKEAGMPARWILPVVPPSTGLLKDKAIFVRRDRETKALADDPASVVSFLSKYRYFEPRVYTKEKYRESLANAIAKLYPKS